VEPTLETDDELR